MEEVVPVIQVVQDEEKTIEIADPVVPEEMIEETTTVTEMDVLQGTVTEGPAETGIKNSHLCSAL